MKNNLKSASLVAAIASLLCAGSAYADLPSSDISAVIGGTVPGGSLNFSNAPLGTASVSFNAGAEVVSFSGGQGGGQIVNGTAGTGVPIYVAPELSSSQGAALSQANGALTQNYATSGINGNATLTFTSAQTSIGFLWGSIDSYNVLTFMNGSTVEGVVTGGDVLAKNGSIDPSGGSNGTDPNGTAYVTITGVPSFTSVVFTDSGQNYNFEFDDIDAPTGVPDGGTTIGLFGMALTGLAMAKRKFMK